MALLALVLSGPQAMANSGLRIVLPQGRVTATDQFQWIFHIRVINGLDAGVYVDSLICTIEDLGSSETRASKVRRVSLDQITTAMRAISRVDSATVRYQGPALVEHARLRFHLKVHDSEERLHEATADLEIHPGPISQRFPSQYLEEKGQRIEYVFVPEVWAQGLSPVVMLVHGEGSHARQLLPVAWELSNRGYSTILVSMPGYGESTGEPDFAGPTTLKALARALQHVRRIPGVDSTRTALWGFSRGATAAALLAAQREDLQGVVLQAGIYDLASAYDSTASEELRAEIRHQAGKRGESWKRRSPRLSSRGIRAPVLIIHGERDQEVPATQALTMAAALRKAGRTATVNLLPEAEHRFATSLAAGPALEFLRAHLRPSKPQ
jgi:dipeptidyl aminopeptidase/acylaminoacyl peptidase